MAYVSKITIKNFRSLEIIEELEVPKLCALVGSNNAGKSNILEAIKRVLEKDWGVTKGSFEQSDIFCADLSRDIEICLEFTPPIVYEKFKNFDPVEIKSLYFKYTKYKIGEQEGEPRLEKACFDSGGQAPLVFDKRPKKGEQSKKIPLTIIPKETLDQIPLIYIGTDRSLKSQLPGAYNSLLGKLFADINENFRDPNNKITGKRNGEIVEVARIDRFNKLIEEALKILKTDSFLELEKQIKKSAFKQLGFDFDKDAEKLDFYFTPPDSMDFYKSLELMVKEGDFVINACKLGSGFQNVLVMAILKAFEERRKQGAILLIEEPEMYLHPHTQRSLYATLKEISKTNQVIYTTHSPHFVDIADYQDVVMIAKTGQKTTAKRSNLTLSTAKIEKFRRTCNPAHNELFLAKRVLFVEGDTEECAFPEWAKKEGHNFDDLGVSVIEVGGKRNLIDYASIALSFGIEIGIVHDTDLPTAKAEDKATIEEENKKLQEFAKISRCPRWEIPKNYETHLRTELGDKVWNDLGEKYQEYGDNKQKQRLIASDASVKTPALFKEIVTWLAGKEDNAAIPRKAAGI